MALLDSKC